MLTTFTLEELEKIYNKATKLYEDIKKIKIRKSMEIYTTPKYYDKSSRYAKYGFNYYLSGRMSIYATDIKDYLEYLKHHIDYKKGIGEEYINNKSVNYIWYGDINSLLDFIYYGDMIKSTIEKEDKETRTELDNLLN